MRLIIIRARTNWRCSTRNAASRTPRNTTSNHKLSIVANAEGRERSRQVIGAVCNRDQPGRIDVRLTVFKSIHCGPKNPALACPAMTEGGELAVSLSANRQGCALNSITNRA
jgi:hypothetical protein